MAADTAARQGRPAWAAVSGRGPEPGAELTRKARRPLQQARCQGRTVSESGPRGARRLAGSGKATGRIREWRVLADSGCDRSQNNSTARVVDGETQCLFQVID